MTGCSAAAACASRTSGDPCEERTVESVWFDTTHGEWEGFVCATHMASAEANHVLTYLGGLERDETGRWVLRPGSIGMGF